MSSAKPPRRISIPPIIPPITNGFPVGGSVGVVEISEGVVGVGLDPVTVVGVGVTVAVVPGTLGVGVTVPDGVAHVLTPSPASPTPPQSFSALTSQV